MGFMDWLFTPERSHANRYGAPNASHETPSPTRIPVTCCGESDWVRGASGYAPSYDGANVHEGSPSASVYCCMHCGRVVGVNRNGTFDPALEAMPSAWAVNVLRLQTAAASAAQESTGAARPAKRSAMRGYRVPRS